MSRTPLGGPWVMTMSAPELMLKSWLSPRLYWNPQSASTDGVRRAGVCGEAGSVGQVEVVGTLVDSWCF